MFSKNIILKLSPSQKTFQMLFFVCLAATLVRSTVQIKRGVNGKEVLKGSAKAKSLPQGRLHANGWVKTNVGSYAYRPCSNKFRGKNLETLSAVLKEVTAIAVKN